MRRNKQKMDIRESQDQEKNSPPPPKASTPAPDLSKETQEVSSILSSLQEVDPEGVTYLNPMDVEEITEDRSDPKSVLRSTKNEEPTILEPVEDIDLLESDEPEVTITSPENDEPELENSSEADASISSIDIIQASANEIMAELDRLTFSDADKVRCRELLSRLLNLSPEDLQKTPYWVDGIAGTEGILIPSSETLGEGGLGSVNKSLLINLKNNQVNVRETAFKTVKADVVASSTNDIKYALEMSQQAEFELAQQVLAWQNEIPPPAGIEYLASPTIIEDASSSRKGLGFELIRDNDQRGGDLFKAIKAGLPFPQTLERLSNAALGLSVLHDKGYIHCDVKMQNMMGEGVVIDMGSVIKKTDISQLQAITVPVDKLPAKEQASYRHADQVTSKRLGEAFPETQEHESTLMIHPRGRTNQNGTTIEQGIGHPTTSKYNSLGLLRLTEKDPSKFDISDRFALVNCLQQVMKLYRLTNMPPELQQLSDELVYLNTVGDNPSAPRKLAEIAKDLNTYAKSII